MSHRLYLKQLTALSANGRWEAAIIRKNAYVDAVDPTAQRESAWLDYFAFRTGRLVEEFEEMLNAEATLGHSPPPVPRGGGVDIPPPQGRGSNRDPS